jgi:hypothetical protein
MDSGFRDLRNTQYYQFAGDGYRHAIEILTSIILR